VVLDVQDDGVGFRNEAQPASVDGGFGLTAMRERVEQLGGSLLIESAPAEGTTLVVTIPLQESGITLAGDKVPVEG
jgi:signal transduction histidine kinase